MSTDLYVLVLLPLLVVPSFPSGLRFPSPLSLSLSLLLQLVQQLLLLFDQFQLLGREHLWNQPVGRGGWGEGGRGERCESETKTRAGRRSREGPAVCVWESAGREENVVQKSLWKRGTGGEQRKRRRRRERERLTAFPGPERVPTAE